MGGSRRVHPELPAQYSCLLGDKSLSEERDHAKSMEREERRQQQPPSLPILLDGNPLTIVSNLF